MSFGTYLHIPFCEKRCDYCAFATWDDRPALLEPYLDGLRREVDAGVEAGLAASTSVFFGGGTPSLLTPGQLASVLSLLPLEPGAEVTVECNPDTVSTEKLVGYAEVGVNRISLGVQSMVPSVLATLGRTHDPANVRTAVDAVREAGASCNLDLSCNIDLIYGSVGETLDDWRRTLVEALALEPDHVSAYGLTVEAGTPLVLDPSRFPDDDDQADKYELADEALSEAGLANYEVSNWARTGAECRHNLLYWSSGDYRGFGCAAHSHGGGRRWWNVRTPERYLALLDDGESVESAGEHLDDSERHLEALQLALRTRAGVPAAALPAHELEGLVEMRGTSVVLTRRGRLLANEVALRLSVP